VVIDERSDAEPDEPEFSVQDGEELVPEAPSVTAPEAEFDADVSSAVRQEAATAFWAMVFLLKPALFGLTLGPLLLYFTDYTRAGIGAICIGVFSLLAVYRRYRLFVADPPQDTTEPEDGDESTVSDESEPADTVDE
jgi:hypothetical protein